MAFNGLNVIKTDITSEEHCILYPVVKTQPSSYQSPGQITEHCQSTYSLPTVYLTVTSTRQIQ